MNKIEVAIVSEALLLTSYVLAHVAVSRFLQPEQRWGAMKRLMFPFIVIASTLGFYLNSESGGVSTMPIALTAALLIAVLIHIGYLTVYAVFDRSISLRVLIEMNLASRAMTYDEIVQKYDPDAAFQRRLEILEENGFFSRENGRYVLKEKGRRTGRLISFLKNLYRTGRGG